LSDRVRVHAPGCVRRRLRAGGSVTATAAEATAAATLAAPAGTALATPAGAARAALDV